MIHKMKGSSPTSKEIYDALLKTKKETMAKTYKFKKDSPEADAGTKLFYQDGGYYYKTRMEEDRFYSKRFVESTPEWFEEIIEETKPNDSRQEYFVIIGGVNELVGLLTDAVSSTRGNQSLTQTQMLFDKFLERRGLLPPCVGRRSVTFPQNIK